MKNSKIFWWSIVALNAILFLIYCIFFVNKKLIPDVISGILIFVVVGAFLVIFGYYNNKITEAKIGIIILLIFNSALYLLSFYYINQIKNLNNYIELYKDDVFLTHNTKIYRIIKSIPNEKMDNKKLLEIFTITLSRSSYLDVDYQLKILKVYKSIIDSRDKIYYSDLNDFHKYVLLEDRSQDEILERLYDLFIKPEFFNEEYSWNITKTINSKKYYDEFTQRYENNKFSDSINFYSLKAYNKFARIEKSNFSKENKKSVEMLYNDGIYYGINGDCFKSVNSFDSAALIDSDNIPVSISLTFAKDCRDGKIPNDVTKEIFTSIAAGNKGNWNSSLNHAKNVLSNIPSYAPAYVHLGVVYTNLYKIKDDQRYQDSIIDAYKTAIKLDTAYGLAHYNLAVIYSVFNKFHSANKHLKLAQLNGFSKKYCEELYKEIVESGYELVVDNENNMQVECQGNFLNGLLGPLALLYYTIASFFSTDGSMSFAIAFDKLWYQGCASCKFGFIVGCLIVLFFIFRIKRK
jgi:hypothetical protein